MSFKLDNVVVEEHSTERWRRRSGRVQSLAFTDLIANSP
jgi:hypothetical protein